MAWTHTFTDAGNGVGTLTAIYNAGQADEWRHDISVDLSIVKDLAPVADKVRAIHAQHLADAAKPDPFADLLAAFDDALNAGGK